MAKVDREMIADTVAEVCGDLRASDQAREKAFHLMALTAQWWGVPVARRYGRGLALVWLRPSGVAIRIDIAPDGWIAKWHPRGGRA